MRHISVRNGTLLGAGYLLAAAGAVATLVLAASPAPAHNQRSDASGLSGFVVIADAATSAVDPSLNADVRFSATNAQRQNGSGQDAGVYLPPLAGAQSEITGTVESESGSAGPSDFYVGAVDEQGGKHFWKGVTDENGHFHLSAPVIAGGIVSLLLFRHFDRHGQPDSGSACQIESTPVHLEGMRAVPGLPATGPGIVESATAYERGGAPNGIVALHTRDIAPLQSRVLLDGSDQNIRTLAASDSSIVGRLSDGTPLGQHAIAVQSGQQRTNQSQTVVVATHFDPLTRMRPGQVQAARLHIEGLGMDRATVTFTVTGAAAIADGSPSKSVAVNDGMASCEIRAQRPGQLVIRTSLEVEIPQGLAESVPSPVVETPHPRTTSGVPSPSPTPSVRKTDMPPVIPKPSTPGQSPPSPEPKRSPTPSPKVTPGGIKIQVSPSPTEYPTPIPVSVAPPPTASPCAYTVTGGLFEPTQGSWQDDEIYRPRPIELRRYSSDTDPPRFDAPMAMVSNRRTLIYGVDHYLRRNGGEVAPLSRHWIEYNVHTNCTELDGVYIHFEAFESLKPIWSANSQPLNSVPFHGPPTRSFHDYTVFMSLRRGFPAAPSTLIFPDLGYVTSYGITAELMISGGGSTGGQSAVTGRVVKTRGPNVHVVPVILVKPHNATDFLALRHSLNESARKLADDIGEHVPDYFPLPPGGKDGAGSMPTIAEQPLDLSAVNVAKGPDEQRISLLQGGAGYSFPNDRLAARLADNLQTRGMLAGAGRIIALMDEHDYFIARDSENAFAYTYSQKLIVGQPANNYFNMAHELIHTLPWDWVQDTTRPEDDQMIVSWMLKECGHEYHNKAEPFPYGVHYLELGMDPGIRDEFGSYTSLIMGPASASIPELSLCDFNHLVHVLQAVPDPHVLLVRGFISRANGDEGAFAALYTTDGYVDLKQGGTGTWAITVHDALGSRTYSFEPRWSTPDLHHNFKVIALNYRIAEPIGAAFVQLVSPHGVVASVRLSQAPPIVRILSPANGATVAAVDGTVDVSWSATATGRRSLRSTVLYSKDGGKNFITQYFEISGSHALVNVDPATSHHAVKVIVTDGTRSNEGVVRFVTR